MTKRGRSVAIAMASLLLVSPAALAQHSGGHGGGHSGGHSYGGHSYGGHGYSHYGHGGGWHGGVYFGFGPWWGYPSYAYPYAYPFGYEYPYPYAYSYPAPAAPSVAEAPSQNFWYYCESSKAYYPYVSSCPEAWRAVPARPQ